MDSCSKQGCYPRVELDAGPRQPSQSHALKAMMGLEVGKSHLHFLALVARFVELRRTHQCAGEIAGILVDVTCDLAKEHLQTAFLFESTCIAIALGREGAQDVIFTNVARRREQLPGRADMAGQT